MLRVHKKISYGTQRYIYYLLRNLLGSISTHYEQNLKGGAMEELVYELFGWTSDDWADVKENVFCSCILLILVCIFIIPWIWGWLSILKLIFL